MRSSLVACALACKVTKNVSGAFHPVLDFSNVQILSEFPEMLPRMQCVITDGFPEMLISMGFHV